jgi:hypothetical protein
MRPRSSSVCLGKRAVPDRIDRNGVGLHHQRENALSLMAALPLAQSDTWVTVLVAVVTGIFGFLSGAGAAAVVTTGHERRQQFRTRMIEAADGFVEKAVSAHLLLAAATQAARRADEASRAGHRVSSDEEWRVAGDRGESAGEHIDELMPGIAHLYVVFRGEDVGDRAVSVHGALVDWRGSLVEALKEGEFSPHEETLEECQQTLRTARNELLRAVNRGVRSRRV